MKCNYVASHIVISIRWEFYWCCSSHVNLANYYSNNGFDSKTLTPVWLHPTNLYLGNPVLPLADAVYLEVIDKTQRRFSNNISPDLAAGLQPLSDRCKVASLRLFHKYIHGNCSNELFDMVRRNFNLSAVRECCRHRINV